MTTAERNRKRAFTALMEQVEMRRLLAFTPTGAPVVVDAGGVAGVDAMAGLADGRHVIAWTAGNSVLVQLYNNDGTPVSGAQQVNTAAGASDADVAITADGSFVVVWEQDDAELSGVYMRRYNGTGAPASAPALVNSTEVGRQTMPSVAISSTGTYTVVWQTADTDFNGPRISGQRFNADGTPSGPETLVSADVDSTNPDVGMAGAGVHVVTWNTATATVAARFDASGNQQGGFITVDNEGGSTPSVGVATNGSFVVAWSVDEDGAGPGISRNVLYQRYNASGATVGGQVVATSSSAGDEAFPQIDVSGAGKFVVGWAEASTTPGTYDQVGFRAFSSSGVTLGDDTLVNAVGFGSNTGFGMVWRDFTPVRVGYMSGADALIQTYESQLVINATNAGQNIQIFGSTNQYRVVQAGVTSIYNSDLFTSIVVNGGDGNDYIRAKDVSLPMTVFGGAGNDSITTGSGNDYVEGGLGNDAINVGAGDDHAMGNEDNDTLFGGGGNDSLTGGPGRNYFDGEDGDDLLTGGNRQDTMWGGAGNDRLRGREHGDALFGEEGDDLLDGGPGNDGLLGGDGTDTLIGSFGADTLRGGDGDDSLLGGAGVDRLFGDKGSDILNGGTEGDYGYTDGLDILIAIEIRRAQ